MNLLEWHEESNENIRSALKRVSLNNKLISPDIQKDIVHSCAKETIRKILKELKDGYFSILVDKSRDVSCKQQMVVVLRYVDRIGFVMKHFLGLIHLTDTTFVTEGKYILFIVSIFLNSISHKRTKV